MVSMTYEVVVLTRSMNRRNTTESGLSLRNTWVVIPVILETLTCYHCAFLDIASSVSSEVLQMPTIPIDY